MRSYNWLSRLLWHEILILSLSVWLVCCLIGMDPVVYITAQIYKWYGRWEKYVYHMSWLSFHICPSHFHCLNGPVIKSETLPVTNILLTIPLPAIRSHVTTMIILLFWLCLTPGTPSLPRLKGRVVIEYSWGQPSLPCTCLSVCLFSGDCCRSFTLSLVWEAWCLDSDLIIPGTWMNFCIGCFLDACSTINMKSVSQGQICWHNFTWKVAVLVFFFVVFFLRSPAISVGFTTFGWDFCVCDCFLI